LFELSSTKENRIYKEGGNKTKTIINTTKNNRNRYSPLFLLEMENADLLIANIYDNYQNALKGTYTKSTSYKELNYQTGSSSLYNNIHQDDIFLF